MAVMPRPRQLYGRPGTQVIPDGWAETHRPVAAGTWTGTVTLRHPGVVLGDLDEDTGTRTDTPHPAYATKPCRVQALATEARELRPGENPLTISGYQVTVDVLVPVAVGDLGVVTDTGDPLLDGRTLRVREVQRGSLLVERVLLCDLTDDT